MNKKGNNKNLGNTETGQGEECSKKKKSIFKILRRKGEDTTSMKKEHEVIKKKHSKDKMCLLK